MGLRVGLNVGLKVGLNVGLNVGLSVGLNVGLRVGLNVVYRVGRKHLSKNDVNEKRQIGVCKNCCFACFREVWHGFQTHIISSGSRQTLPSSVIVSTYGIMSSFVPKTLIPFLLA